MLKKLFFQTTLKKSIGFDQNVSDLYARVIPNVFVLSKKGQGIADRLLAWTRQNTGLKKPLYPYSTKPLLNVLDNIFGDTYTDEMEYNGCVSGAVARRFNENHEADHLEIFDTKTRPLQQIRQVLAASSDAPIYFEIPAEIGGKFYVDGGILGKKKLGGLKFGRPKIRADYNS